MNKVSQLRIPGILDNLTHIRRFVRETCSSLDANQGGTEELVLAVDEAATNIIRHGYRSQPGEIEIDIFTKADAIIVTLRDQAKHFNPTLTPEPDLDLPLEQRSLGGLGVFLIRKSVDRMSHRSLPEGGNELTLVKHSILNTE